MVFVREVKREKLKVVLLTKIWRAESCEKRISHNRVCTMPLKRGKKKL